MVLKLLKMVIYVWDVVFTFIDNQQLRGYLKLCEMRDKRIYPTKKSQWHNDTWEDLH